MGLEPPLHDPHTSMPGIDTSLSCDSRPRNSKSRPRTQTCAFTYSRVFSLNKSIRTWRRTKTFVLLVFILVLLAYSLSLCLCLCMYLCHDENQAYDEHHCHFAREILPSVPYCRARAFPGISNRIEVYAQPRRCLQDGGNHAGNDKFAIGYAVIFKSKVERLFLRCLTKILV